MWGNKEIKKLKVTNSKDLDVLTKKERAMVENHLDHAGQIPFIKMPNLCKVEVLSSGKGGVRLRLRRECKPKLDPELDAELDHKLDPKRDPG